MFRLRQNPPTPFYDFTVGIKRRDRKLRLTMGESALVDVHTDRVDTYKLQRLKCPELLDDLRGLGCLFPRGFGKARLHVIVVGSTFLFPGCYKAAERCVGPRTWNAILDAPLQLGDGCLCCLCWYSMPGCLATILMQD